MEDACERRHVGVREVFDGVATAGVFAVVPREVQAIVPDVPDDIEVIGPHRLWRAVAPLNGPGGSTPLGAALVLGEQAIEGACLQGLLERRFFVMVVTDGMPNCDTDMTAAAAIVAKWSEHGIETYVIGLPGSEGATFVLDALAKAGGTETIVVPGSPSELEDDMGAMM